MSNGDGTDDRFELDPRWSDTGDRYILKLFRDYVFHSISVDGSPILDLSHVLTSLNKVSRGRNGGLYFRCSLSIDTGTADKSSIRVWMNVSCSFRGMINLVSL